MICCFLPAPLVFGGFLFYVYRIFFSIHIHSFWILSVVPICLNQYVPQSVAPFRPPDSNGRDCIAWAFHAKPVVDVSEIGAAGMVVDM